MFSTRTWVGRRSEEPLPHLRDAQDRRVTVHPVILPRDKGTRHLAARPSELATQVPATVYLWDEHQKIIVIVTARLPGHPATSVESLARLRLI